MWVFTFFERPTRKKVFPCASLAIFCLSAPACWDSSGLFHLIHTSQRPLGLITVDIARHFLISSCCLPSLKIPLPATCIIHSECRGSQLPHLQKNPEPQSHDQAGCIHQCPFQTLPFQIHLSWILLFQNHSLPVHPHPPPHFLPFKNACCILKRVKLCLSHYLDPGGVKVPCCHHWQYLCWGHVQLWKGSLKLLQL